MNATSFVKEPDIHTYPVNCGDSRDISNCRGHYAGSAPMDIIAYCFVTVATLTATEKTV